MDKPKPIRRQTTVSTRGAMAPAIQAAKQFFHAETPQEAIQLATVAWHHEHSTLIPLLQEIKGLLTQLVEQQEKNAPSA